MKEKIATSEWKVMEVLWEEPNIFAADIVKRLSEESWSDKTIRTLISRLVKKGLVNYEKVGKMYRYYPVVERHACVLEESQAFIDKIFGGSPSAFVSNLIKSEKLSKDELDELRRLLKNKEN